MPSSLTEDPCVGKGLGFPLYISECIKTGVKTLWLRAA